MRNCHRERQDGAWRSHKCHVHYVPMHNANITYEIASAQVGLLFARYCRQGVLQIGVSIKKTFNCRAGSPNPAEHNPAVPGGIRRCRPTEERKPTHPFILSAFSLATNSMPVVTGSSQRHVFGFSYLRLKAALRCLLTIGCHRDCFFNSFVLFLMQRGNFLFLK